MKTASIVRRWTHTALFAASTACVALLAHGANPPSSTHDGAIDAPTRATVVEAAAAQLEQNYVYADKGRAYAALLRENFRSGRYDHVSGGTALAERLTQDLRVVAKDKHLEVRYFEDSVPDTDPDSDTTSTDKEQFHMRWMNGGFEKVERLPGNLGFIDLHLFARPNVAESRIDAAMALLADSKALIIDLRSCGGGDPETVMLLASRLFDRRTHLNDIYSRETDAIEERWTQPVGGARYGQQRAIYLLTSADTASGCEDFAYALQANRRAVVIGDTTAGAANGGSPQRLSEHFMMFVPTFRPVNPITHGDWEGVGVKPDHAVPVKDAQMAAQKIALQTLIEAETNPDAMRRLTGALKEL